MVDGYALFVSMGTQWQITGAGMAGAFHTGLRYEAIAPTAAGLNINLTPAVFADLRTLESEALRYWSARSG